MKKLKRFIAIFLSICLSTYTLPSFAAQPGVVEAAQAEIIEITDMQMSNLIGAAGHVDAKVSDYPIGGEDAEAVIVNRSGLTLPYSLVGTDIGRNVTEVIASGNLNPNQAVIVGGPVTNGATYVLQARIGGTGIKALESIDSTFR